VRIDRAGEHVQASRVDMTMRVLGQVGFLLNRNDLPVANPDLASHDLPLRSVHGASADDKVERRWHEASLS